MLITQSLKRIHAFLLENAPAQLAQWSNGLSEEQINDLLKDTPCILLDDLRGLYKWHNGSGYNSICDNYRLYSLENAMELYKFYSAFPGLYKPGLFPFAINSVQDILFVNCYSKQPEVEYMFCEDGSKEIFWSSITKMMQTIAEAYETGAFYLDNDYFASDNRKFLEVMWRNDPDIINLLIEQLRTVKEERLNRIPGGYESIQRFVWQDISKPFNAIRSTLLSDPERVDLLQEFTSNFLEECERIINVSI
jgi:hypothetical protein